MNRFQFCLALAFCLTLSGCIIVPIDSRQRVAHKRETVVKLNQSLADVRSAGVLDGYYPDLRVGYILKKKVQLRTLWLALFILPIETRNLGEAYDVEFISFDENELSRRIETIKAIREEDLYKKANEWLTQDASHTPESTRSSRSKLVTSSSHCSESSFRIAHLAERLAPARIHCSPR